MSRIVRKTEFMLGDNIHGQPVHLIFEGGVWTIRRGPANQRDDTVFVGGLTDRMILDMAECVNEGRGPR